MKQFTLALCKMVLLVLSLSLAQRAGAASAYWDINDATPGAGGPTPSGAWESAFWSTDSTGSSPTANWTDGDFPIFAAGTDATGSSFVVTVSGTHTIAGMQMLAPCTNVVVNGTGTLNIADGLQGFFPNGASLGGSGLWLNVPLGGTGGIINQNSSYLYLYGNNTYSGGTTFTANHIIYYNNDHSFGTGPITNAAPSLSLLTTNALALTPNLSNDIWINNGGGVFNFGAGNTICSGHFYLQSALQLKNNSPDTSSLLTISGPISETNGSFGLNLLCPNGATLVLSGPNTYSGKTTIGVLAGGSKTNTVSVSSLNSVNGGTPLLASSSLGCPTTAADGTIDLGYLTYPAALIYTGSGETSDRVLNLAGTTASATLDQSGAGLLKFTSDLTATGVGSKTLLLQGATAGAGEIAGAIVDNPTTGSTLLAAAFSSGKATITLAAVDGISVGAAISGTGIPAGDTVKSVNTSTKVVTLNTATTGAGTVGQTITVAGVLNSTYVTKAGPGTWVLSGANTYSGDTTLSAGILQLGAVNAVPHGPGHGKCALNGGTLELAGFDCSINGGGGAGAVDNNAGTATLTIDNNNNNTGPTYSGRIGETSPGVLNFAANCGGTCQLTAAGGNTYSGYSAVSNAVLQITAENQLGVVPANLVLTNIILDSNLGWNPASGANTGNYYLRLQTTASVDLSATRGIVLGNAQGYGGGLGAQSGKTLNVRGPISGPGGLWLGGGTVGAGVGTVALFNTGNSYAGGTYIVGGTLTLGDNGVLPSGTPLWMGTSAAGGGTYFNMNGKSQTIGPLTGYAGANGPQIKLTGALTIVQSAPTTFNGVISQAGGSLTLDASSTSTLTLAGVNTYTGPTTVNGGTLEIAATGSLASPTVTVADGATLQLDAATALNPNARLLLRPGSPRVNLVTGTSQVALLSFDGGATFAAAGTYGRLGSGAPHEDGRFTGDGFLTVQFIPSQVNVLQGITQTGSGSFSLSFQGTPQARYYLLYQTNLAEPLANWMPVPGSTNVATDPSGLVTFPVTLPAPAFYRSVAIDPAP